VEYITILQSSACGIEYAWMGAGVADAASKAGDAKDSVQETANNAGLE